MIQFYVNWTKDWCQNDKKSCLKFGVAYAGAVKKIYLILGTALVIISVCMIIITMRGAGLRTEPIIKPSPIDEAHANIAFGVIRRMFPSFQKADYVVWGADLEKITEENDIIKLLQKEHLAQLGTYPNPKVVTIYTPNEEIKNCTKPCWIIVDKNHANQLDNKQNPILEKVKAELGLNYFSVTIMEFTRDVAVSETCNNEKFITSDCIMPISVREAKRFMKDLKTRYFFMRRYNELDYFLFLQKN